MDGMGYVFFLNFVQLDIWMTLSGQPINGDKKAPAPQERSGDVNACEKSGERFQLYQPIPNTPCMEDLTYNLPYLLW